MPTASQLDVRGSLAEFYDAASASVRKAGSDYVRDGAIRDASVSPKQLLATVTGRTDYKVTVSWSPSGEVKTGCTCPAHRRQGICKHAIAVIDAFLNQPGQFNEIADEETPTGAQPAKRKRDGTAKQRAAALRSEQQRTALHLVDRVLEELAAGGISALGEEQRALLSNAAETVRGMKLRRLGNLMVELINLVSRPAGGDPDQERFAALLIELGYMRQIVGAHFDGSASLDQDQIDRLLGKVWRAADLPQRTGLDLVAVAEERIDDGEFRIDSTYLADLGSGDLFVERAITPVGLRAAARPSRRLRMRAETAGVYPDTSPPRIRLDSVETGTLSADDMAKVVALAASSLETIGGRLVETLSAPAGETESLVLFRPAALIRIDDGIAALDEARRQIRLALPDNWSGSLWPLLPVDLSRIAFVGYAGIDRSGPRLRCLSCVGDLRWPNGPVFPGVT
jgi:hypothetical protein